MDTTDAKQIVDIAQGLNQLRSDVLQFIITMTVLVVGYMVLSKVLAARAKRREEESKNARAQMYADAQKRQADAINSLAKAMQDHTTSDTAMATQLNTTMTNVGDVTSDLKGAVELLVAKNEGRINREDSVKMIRDRFITHVYREFTTIIEVSLRENDYVNRKAHVTRKVKTELGKVLIEARRYLASFNMSVDPAVFFQLAPDDHGERFILCDAVWSDVEGLFLRDHSTPAKLKQVTEEAYVIIENVIKDYVTQCGRGNNCSIDFRNPASESNAQLLMTRTTRLLEAESVPSVMK